MKRGQPFGSRESWTLQSFATTQKLLAYVWTENVPKKRQKNFSTTM